MAAIHAGTASNDPSAINPLPPLPYDDSFWGTVSDRLFPYAQFIDFCSASIATPMRLPDPEELTCPFAWLREDSIQKMSERVEHARKRLAELMHADADDIYFANNTTSAMDNALKSLEFKPGDEIVTTTEEYGTINHVIDGIVRDTGATVVRVETGRDLLGRIQQLINKGIEQAASADGV